MSEGEQVKVDLCPKFFIAEDEIQEKVNELASRISSDYESKDLVVVGILKGAWIFMADLVRKISFPVRCDFMQLGSYNGTKTTGSVEVFVDMTESLVGKDVLIVEDIVDTGITMEYLLGLMHDRGVRSVEICSLLDKPSRRRVDVSIKYIGFTIPDKFIVGYGLDLDQEFRNLAYIGLI